MRIRVDSEKCQGHNRCYALAPELFDVDDYGTATALHDGVVPDGKESQAQLAIDNCPEFAIAVVDDCPLGSLARPRQATAVDGRLSRRRGPHVRSAWRSVEGSGDMGLANGVHHLAICTADIKRQIEFFTDVLGAELKALYWMHGVEGAWHGFLRLNDASYVAFVQTPDVGGIQPELGVTHAANGGAPSAPGTQQHVAFSAATRDELLTLRDRLRDRGVNVMGPIEHGMCTSIYFAGPEGLNLEISWSAEPIDERAWIAPEVAALAGIEPDELAGYLAPTAYENTTGAPVPNPEIDPAKPHMVYPPEIYRAIMSMPDDELTARFSETEPPVSATS